MGGRNPGNRWVKGCSFRRGSIRNFHLKKTRLGLERGEGSEQSPSPTAPNEGAWCQNVGRSYKQALEVKQRACGHWFGGTMPLRQQPELSKRGAPVPLLQRGGWGKHNG